MRTRLAFVLAVLFVLSAPFAHAANSADGDVSCRATDLAALRRDALDARHASGKTPAVAANDALERLRPAVDAHCLDRRADDDASIDPQQPPARLPRRDALEYAWLLSDASVYFIDANRGRNGLAGSLGDDYCFRALSPLLDENYRPVPWLPAALRSAVATNVKQCVAQCVQTSCVPDVANVWAGQHSEAGAFVQHPACPFDSRLVQLRDGVCVGFDGGAFAHAHPTSEADSFSCSSAADAKAPCPRLFVLTRSADRSVVRTFAPLKGTALDDASVACNVDSIGVSSDGTRFALMGEGRDCFGGTAQTAVEEIYTLKDGQPVLLKNNTAGLH